MRKAYDEIMDRITVTEEMRERVMRRIAQERIGYSRAPRTPFLKRYLAAAACLVLLLAGAIGLPHLIRPGQSDPPLVAVTPNIVEAASLSELSELVGFAVTERFALPFPVAQTSYSAYWNTLAEIRYSGEGRSAIFRQSVGTGDNSGDYTVFEETAEISVNGLDITLNGADGGYSLALWTDDEYAYSLRLSPEATSDEWMVVFSGQP